MNQAVPEQVKLSSTSNKLFTTEIQSISNPTYPAMDPILSYDALPNLSSTLLNTPTYNDFDVAFGFASNTSYPEPHSGPQSPSYSHSHDDTTSDESPDLHQITSKPRTMSTRRRAPGSRKTPQPQEQILKRRVQNRAAQRSFRERQKEYVHDLEHQVEALKGEIEKLHGNYQELLKAVTAGPRIPQWNADLSLSPALTDEMEFNGDALESIKTEHMWPVDSSRDYEGLLYN